MDQYWSEIKKFDNIASRWWDFDSEFKPLHQINPIRSEWITQFILPKDKTLLDIGCGGGILTESLAKKGAIAIGIDLSVEAIRAAKQHSKITNLKIEYHNTSVEEFKKQSVVQDVLPKSDSKITFDFITCMEMLEHVPEPERIIAECKNLLQPGGWLFLSTINKNNTSFLGGIIAAEYILKMLPRGTHDWNKLISPEDLTKILRQNSFEIKAISGLQYSLITKSYYLSSNVDINYMVACQMI